MEIIQGSPADRDQLDQWMNARRLALRMKWTEVAQKADMTPQNLLRIRQGTIGITWDAADGIERALRWERGSVESAVLEGHEPIALPPSPTSGTAPEGDEMPPEPAPSNEPSPEPRPEDYPDEHEYMNAVYWYLRQWMSHDAVMRGFHMAAAIYERKNTERPAPKAPGNKVG